MRVASLATCLALLVQVGQWTISIFKVCSAAVEIALHGFYAARGTLISCRSLYRVTPSATSMSLWFGLAAPVLGRDVAHGLGEIPTMAEGIFSVVLALAVRVIDGFGQD